jgi:hypothetical protein
VIEKYIFPEAAKIFAKERTLDRIVKKLLAIQKFDLSRPF